MVYIASLLLGLAASALAAPTPNPGPEPDLAELEAHVANITKRFNELPHVQYQEMAARGIFPGVTVAAPAGTFNGASRPDIEAFTGIPFAQAPRLAPPVKYTTPFNNFDATVYAASCPQFIGTTKPGGDFFGMIVNALTNTPFLKVALNQKEDCLNLAIYRPKGTNPNSKLPVLFWIYGGSFTFGWNSMYDGGSLVSEATTNGKPYILVVINYRVGGWGFLHGKEATAAGATNLGLQDQRAALEWVADNIGAFGGDPDKVTLWGESAGSISVWHQASLLDGNNIYKGKALFRGGIMSSGSIVPAQSSTSKKAQDVYDTVVSRGGCAGTPDTFACLRALPYQKLYDTFNSLPTSLGFNSVALAYLPRPDGKWLTASTDDLLYAGKYADIPFIIGDQEDEGTIFSLQQASISGSTEGIVGYLSSLYFDQATPDQIRGHVNTYPNDLTAGSPFRTWIFNEVYFGYKRIAAILGDMVFTITRRVHLKTASAVKPNTPSWSYLASYDFGIPVVGTFHASDIVQVWFGILPNYASKNIRNYFANFVYNLDPNNASGGTNGNSKVREVWPRWNPANPVLIQFFAGFFGTIKDDFRQASADSLEKNRQVFRI
ncbi:putative secreted lipase [Vanrija pseudolonga]|uniref:Carboxylic ester hydrolase n=1 Tax=Vanrija pseudolonga TaxID=143232 RepID=A0AAF0YIT1_9TREE|nr:putative secreted lipase [Vanrija pseudolonga]